MAHLNTSGERKFFQKIVWLTINYHNLMQLVCGDSVLNLTYIMSSKLMVGLQMTSSAVSRVVASSAVVVLILSNWTMYVKTES